MTIFYRPYWHGNAIYEIYQSWSSETCCKENFQRERFEGIATDYPSLNEVWISAQSIMFRDFLEMTANYVAIVFRYSEWVVRLTWAETA